MPDTFGSTVQLTVIAMGIVFAVLMGLGLLITLSRLVLVRDKPQSQTPTVSPAADDGEETDDSPTGTEEEALPEETVAVITAAVYAYMGQGRWHQRAQEGTDNAWLRAGRQELMARRTGRR